MHSIWLEIQRIQQAVEALVKAVANQYELSTTELHTILSLYEQDGQSASQLARSVHRQPTSFTPVIDGLEERGWVERRADKRDRRRTIIFLSTRAKTVRTNLQRDFTTADSHASAALPRQRAYTLLRALMGHPSARLDPQPLFDSPIGEDAPRGH